jgi:hypothetical protein
MNTQADYETDIQVPKHDPATTPINVTYRMEKFRLRRLRRVRRTPEYRTRLAEIRAAHKNEEGQTDET